MIYFNEILMYANEQKPNFSGNCNSMSQRR